MRRPTLTLGEMLHNLETRTGRVTSYIFYILNIVFLGLYIVGTYDFASSYIGIIYVLETILALTFTFEYISRLDFADSAWEEAKSPYAIADLLAVLPALLVIFIPVLSNVAFLRSLQVLRVFRFVRVGLENGKFFNYELSDRGVIAAQGLTAIMVIITLTAGFVYAVETNTNPAFQNFGDAFYFAIVALTTTGFGNVTPITTLGKTFTAIGLIAAITVIPWIVFRARNGGELHHECQRCGLDEHPADSRYCRRCGERLEKN